MRHKFVPLILAAVILLSGCASSNGIPSQEETEPASSQAESVRLPSVNPDFVYLETENCYVDLAADAVFFRLLSGKPLSKDDVSAKLDLPDSCYNLSFSESASISLAFMDSSESYSKFSPELYMCYQGVNWKEYGRLYTASEEARGDGDYEAATKYWTELESLIKPFDTAFKSIDIEKIPAVYQYGLYLQLNFDNIPNGDFAAKELTLTVNGKTQKYALEDLVYSANPGRTVPAVHPDNLLSSDTLAIMQYLTLPSLTGSIDLLPVSLIVKGDLALKRIEFLNHPSVKCTKASVISTGEDGLSVERAWDGNSLFQLNSGENTEFYITLENPLFAGKLSGIFADTLVIIYEVDGVEYSEQITISYNVAVNKYFIYAREQDGIDVQSYFDNSYFLTDVSDGVVVG